MSYDLVVGISDKIKDKAEIVGTIDFDELPILAKLAKRIDSSFLSRICNLFEDQSFSIEETSLAINQLYPLLIEKLDVDEKNMLHKLIAVLSYANYKNQKLFGVAD